MYKKVLFLSLALTLVLSIVPISVSFAFTDYSNDFNNAVNNLIDPGKSVEGVVPEIPNEWTEHYNSSRATMNVIDGALGKKEGDKSVLYRQFRNISEASAYPQTLPESDAFFTIAPGLKASVKANVFVPDMDYEDNNPATQSMYNLAVTMRATTSDVNGVEIGTRGNQFRFQGNGYLMGEYYDSRTGSRTVRNYFSYDDTKKSFGFKRQQWYSVAAIVEGNEISLYIDGVKLPAVRTTTVAGDYISKLNIRFELNTRSTLINNVPGYVIFDDLDMRNTSDGSAESDDLYDYKKSSTAFTLKPNAPFEVLHHTFHSKTPQLESKINKVISGTTVGELLSYIDPVPGGEVYAVNYDVDYDADYENDGILDFKTPKTNPVDLFKTILLDDNAIVDSNTKIISVSADKSMKIYDTTVIAEPAGTDTAVLSSGIYYLQSSTQPPRIDEVTDYVSTEEFLKQIRLSDPRAKKEVILNSDSSVYIGTMRQNNSRYSLKITSYDESLSTLYDIYFEGAIRFNPNWTASIYTDGSGGPFYTSVNGVTSGTRPAGFSSAILPSAGNVAITGKTVANPEGMLITNDSEDIFALKSSNNRLERREMEMATVFTVKQVDPGKFVYSNLYVRNLGGAVEAVPIIKIEDGKFWFNNTPIAYCNTSTAYNVAVTIDFPKSNAIDRLKVGKIWINGILVLENGYIPLFDVANLEESGQGFSGVQVDVKGGYVLGDMRSISCGVNGYSPEASAISVISSVYDIDLFEEKYTAPVVTGDFTTVADLISGLTTEAAVAVKNSDGSPTNGTDAVIDGMIIELTAGTSKAIYYASVSSFSDSSGIAASISGSQDNTFIFNKSVYISDDAEVILAGYSGNQLQAVGLEGKSTPASVTLTTKTDAKIRAIYLKDLTSLSPIGSYDELN